MLLRPAPVSAATITAELKDSNSLLFKEQETSLIEQIRRIREHIKRAELAELLKLRDQKLEDAEEQSTLAHKAKQKADLEGLMQYFNEQKRIAALQLQTEPSTPTHSVAQFEIELLDLIQQQAESEQQHIAIQEEIQAARQQVANDIINQFDAYLLPEEAAEINRLVNHEVPVQRLFQYIPALADLHNAELNNVREQKVVAGLDRHAPETEIKAQVETQEKMGFDRKQAGFLELQLVYNLTNSYNRLRNELEEQKKHPVKEKKLDPSVVQAVEAVMAASAKRGVYNYFTTHLKSHMLAISQQNKILQAERIRHLVTNNCLSKQAMALQDVIKTSMQTQQIDTPKMLALIMKYNESRTKPFDPAPLAEAIRFSLR